MNLLYVAQASNDLKDSLLIINGADNKIIDIIKIEMRIVEIAFNASSGLIYVLSDSDPDIDHPVNIVTVIDSSTNKTVSSFVGGLAREFSVDIDINVKTNRIYVSTTGFAVRTIEVFDGNNNENIATIDFNKDAKVDDILNGGNIVKIAVNSTTNQIYALENREVNNDRICLINGISNEIINCIDNVGQDLFDIAVNPVTNNIYVSDKGADRLVIFSDDPIIIPPMEDCEAEFMEIIPDKITLGKGENKDVNIKLTGKEGCSVKNVTINSRINLLGRRSITLSSSSILTDSNGNATFSISAKSNHGNARILFSTNELKKSVKVNISRR